MGFLIRKLLTALVMPLPALLFVGLVGSVLWARGKRPRLGQLMVALSLLALGALSTDPVSYRLARALEQQYPAFPGDSVAYVVVLGSGHDSDPLFPQSARLTEQGMYRVAEGVSIAVAQPWTQLIMSGYGGTDPVPNAQVAAETAVALGFPEARIITEPRPNSTAQEAEYLEPMLQGHAFALVTSATHIPRAVALFRARGLSPIPAPTGHLGKRSSGAGPTRFVPSAGDLSRTSAVWYEFLGRVWSKVRGLS
jgi:uncharacterized SAM-binding protein YcdF (DUF218 family)